MLDKIASFALAAVCLTATVCWGCSRGPSRVYPPAIDAAAAGRDAMAQYDSDRDGKVAGEELDKAPALKAALKNLDADGDLAVNAGEVTARVKAWQQTKLGRMVLSCQVNMDGRPLPGANVTFVPEEFLGDEIRPATGVTDAQGIATLTVQGDPDGPPGVPPGLYRVSITKEGADIPTKYNTETILGQEVALDAGNIQEGIVFKLERDNSQPK